MRKVEVHRYNSDWSRQFDLEKQALMHIYQTLAASYHHIGSTSIPNMSAKPIIDIMIEVDDLGLVDSLNGLMENIGYEARGENGVEDRRYFQKGGNHRTHHVHVFPTGHPQVLRHIIFRGYLINHSDEAMEYATLKERLATQYANDIASYIAEKDAFIKEIDRKAAKWYSNNR
ncbi:GrpB family protein [Bacillus sp. SM2101]|uniref:GrpB family protein n=1 Tax=Bacillus sp. SM2101 TaxID=2805366 RepID=UPI001BDECA81|nr:GrpB family protein [Bacillus sp. SM2101]